MGILKNRIEDYLYAKWDKQGRFPSWATYFYPYIHFCPAMDDLLVTTPENCYCEHITVEEKDKAREKWHNGNLHK